MSRYLILLIACSVISMNPMAQGQTCGLIEFDDGNSIISERSPELEAWVLKSCSFDISVRISHVSWVQLLYWDTWNGLADFSVWTSSEVEDDCARDDTALTQVWDLAAWRSDGFDCGFTGCFYQYETDLDLVLLKGEYYISARQVSTESRPGAAIRWRACQGDPPVFFQSDYFGYPCATPGNEVMGRDFCVAMAVTFEPIVVDCEKLRRLRARTNCRRQKVKAKVRSRFAEGTELTLFLDGRRPQTVTIDDRGRAKVKWENADGGEVCIAGCEDQCVTAPPCGG